jgi:DNA-binding LytR/AlgR family response regulator
MKMVIIEDEPLASERLKMLLMQYDCLATLSASLESVDEAVKWLSQNPSPDLIFSDIQLSDGSAFEIFRQVKISAPVIFTTAYDQYALDAFKILSIDYLLKPVTLQALNIAMGKLKQFHALEANPLWRFDEILKLIPQKAPHYKSRFTGKIGNKLFFIEAKDVSLFYSDNKIVYIIPSDSARYISEHTLEHLEELLDPSSFFRINRSMIVNIHAINQVRPYENNRLQIILKKHINDDAIIVSRERVPDFKKWTDN